MEDEFKNEEEVVEDADLEGILLGRECEDKTVDENNNFHGSDYSLHGETY